MGGAEFSAAAMGTRHLTPRMDRRSIRAAFGALKVGDHEQGAVGGFEHPEFRLDELRESVTKDPRIVSRTSQSPLTAKRRSR